MNKAMAIGMVMALAGAAQAQTTLWDQSQLDWNASGFYNSISGSPPFGSTVYTVADVTVPAGGWTMTSISMYYSQILGDWSQSVTQGRLYVQPKTGAMPTINPGGSLIPMSAVLFFDPIVQQAYAEVTASGLSIPLAAGEYWIGITPSAAAGPWGPELGIASANPTGTNSRSFAVGGFPSGWQDTTVDAAIKIRGIPTPGTLGLLAMGSLAAVRRRRA
ncbi:MAG: hypothetical protein HUU18_07645 [Phycisphaerales bacterium]|jgi:hypothetical protein|nr:hypothetical protein [Phycisphaerales bacterium]